MWLKNNLFQQLILVFGLRVLFSRIPFYSLSVLQQAMIIIGIVSVLFFVLRTKIKHEN